MLPWGSAAPARPAKAATRASKTCLLYTSRQVFGAEAAPGVAAHGREIKAAGAKYCDCPACAAAAAILEKKDLLLK